MNLKINKEKNIGQVIYIFEGEEIESKLFNHIFGTFLDYSVISLDKANNEFLYTSKTNKYSKVFLIPSKRSQAVSIEDDKQYFDELYKMLAIKHGLDVENCAVYYIYDRDRNNNGFKDLNRIVSKYENSRDNNNEMNGLVLLSYPSVEAYLMTAYNDLERIGNAQFAKMHCAAEGYYCIDNLEDEHIKNCVANMLNTIENIINNTFDINEIEHFSNINTKILEYEEALYRDDTTYYILSLISISLIDLGIIQFE